MVEKQNSIRFLQHNTKKVDAIHQTVLQLAFEQNIQILLLQEPYLLRTTTKDGKTTYAAVNHPAYYTVLPQPSNPSSIEVKPRVIAYIKKGLEFTTDYD